MKLRDQVPAVVTDVSWPSEAKKQKRLEEPLRRR